MSSNLLFEGIYDKRTLTYLKSLGVAHFGFNFSPKSFNFIQEHIFLKELVPLLSLQDTLYLHFSTSKDPMASRVLENLLAKGVGPERVTINFDEITESDWDTKGAGLLVSYPKTNAALFEHPHLKGFILDYLLLEELNEKGALNNFSRNFLSVTAPYGGQTLLRLNWDSNLLERVLRIFDFDLVSLPIDSKIEICYRNVDLNKLEKEASLIKKQINS